MNKPTRLAIAAVALGSAGCGAMDSVQSFEMRREADGARASCGQTTAPTSLGGGNIDPAVARCVTACKQLGFVVESTLPPGLINKKIDMAGGIPASECLILKK
ncbi:hypothetical protein FJV83_13695 [Mesorhizobium sp. WSM4307]|uniref:hypothetical protein n=1 Tax=unclassified Mesorhizobium TaxID=325217 RepID=UPI00115C98DE|nr:MULTISPECIES: hypothetical protein [unclassified Mesorhizobium]TRC75066.1 hypothetical protein FJV81_19510 [Mesorhizobium sp. WSM4315]TRC84752.1 hypothetical protein FJV83_13695 [Mesorhizobium sp. WSM4307]